jgi:N-methylhydantoinase A
VRVTGTLLNGARPIIGSVPDRPRDLRLPTTRRAYFGPAFGSINTPVLRRSGLGNDPQEGPLIIEEYEGTTVIPPRSRASLDPHGNIAIDIDP